ncbi:MAG: polysaccharide biosynthesis/export family protein, partial [Rhodoferax sp.]|nr:polysaccharide biosynthesis/export family protein [Rhodoferax sp.]
MPITNTPALKFWVRSLAVAALALAFGTSLQAQTATVVTSPGSVNTGSLNASTTAASEGPTGNPLLRDRAPQANANADSPATDAPAPDFVPTRAVQRIVVPNQFQRFVQESTGRLLPVFGRDLFDSPQAYAANTNVPAPDNYILGPGDQVRLQVSGPQDFSTNLVLDRNGQVNLPKVGPVTLAGVAVRDLEPTLSTQLGKIFTNFKASATLGRLRGIQVYVVGQALQPGTFQLSSVSTLVNALFASGGPGANGSMRAIELKRAGKTVTTIDLYDFISRGDKSHDLPLLAGDVIVIPPVGPRVAVTGAFDQAAIYELKPGGSSVADILNLGGGVPALAKSKKAVLERINPDTTPARSVQEIMLNAQGLQSKLQDGDVLLLLDISPAFANAVTLQGVVAERIRSSWFDGMRILDLIPDREALITPDYYKRKNILVQKIEVDPASDGKSKEAGDKSKDAGKQVDSRIRSMVDQIN